MPNYFFVLSDIMVAEAESPDMVELPIVDAESDIIPVESDIVVVEVSVVSVFLDEQAVASANTVMATKPVLMIAFISLDVFV